PFGKLNKKKRAPRDRQCPRGARFLFGLLVQEHLCRPPESGQGIVKKGAERGAVIIAPLRAKSGPIPAAAPPADGLIRTAAAGLGTQLPLQQELPAFLPIEGLLD